VPPDVTAATVISRAVDDSLNVERDGAGIRLKIAAPSNDEGS
jgi:hypothetical protein